MIFGRIIRRNLLQVEPYAVAGSSNETTSQKQTWKLVPQFQKDTKTKVLEWPAQSPDFDQIQSLLRVLKVIVHAGKPQTLDQLGCISMEEKAKIPLETWAPRKDLF